ncbi:tRNA (adenosine(37)-N6)-threonylcarbamoyltransferase complex dimerization subunit type 1 TsaB [Brachybacterium sp. Marseille-Q2903]|uniref:tRNA (Adenosine(37)-N6)-threonylcarbamoyltransferase complex dimerization subunit type 1 TsaB n=1 Tax=Brachybacterium epidermidis TaxID=2781983 RepID=A0ABR9VX58_9MICO|nr:tRNA (adenosine(37)-N6)-threonylcarbamoyltransferase complex dimerization subunit type 1 TsaB [Brachybacterium epidermidis]MBE9402772.1 tRNA (adenosine(37)-N6)-threonylcarbamoyltransferase complex dimerization subunit type 1 TsaB [Brachybacterium epidermidis]
MLLGIDTSGAVSTAVMGGDLDAPDAAVRHVRSDARARHHDEVLLALVDGVMQDAGASRAGLTGVVVGRGPGPFTGLRVGLVAARSIAAVLGIPLHGVCSLDALAHQALAEADGADGVAGNARDLPERTVAVALDARRREVYHARYRRLADGTVRRESGPAVAPPADVAAELTACGLLVGSGTRLYPDLLPATSELVDADASHLIEVAALLHAQGEDLTSTDPLYLRDPDAAKPTSRKSALGR